MPAMPWASIAVGMGGIVAQAEQAAMDLRMEGLDPAVHDLGKAGGLGKVGDGDAGLVEGGAGAAGRDDLDAARPELAGEIDDAGLVENRDQRAPDGDAVGRREFCRGNGHWSPHGRGARGDRPIARFPPGQMRPGDGFRMA